MNINAKYDWQEPPQVGKIIKIKKKQLKSQISDLSAEPVTVFLQSMNVFFSSEVFCNTESGKKWKSCTQKDFRSQNMYIENSSGAEDGAVLGRRKCCLCPQGSTTE